MAKTISHITRGIQGTLGDLTFVKSKRYGKHVRSKRGTIKPVSLNNSLEENTAELTSAVLPAKLVFNAIRDEHKDGTLWTRLLNIYRKKLKVGSTPDLLCIKDLECSKEFRLDTRLSDYRVEGHIENNMLRVSARINYPPIWRKLKYVEGYRLSLIIIFVDFASNQLEKKIIRGPLTLQTAPLETLTGELPVPSFAKEYALFLMVEACADQELVGTDNVKGMRVVKLGVVNQND